MFQVIRGEADFSLEQPFVYAKFLGEMTMSTYVHVAAYFEARPKPLAKLWNFSFSLDKPTWFFLFTSCVIVASSLYIMSQHEQKKVFLIY